MPANKKYLTSSSWQKFAKFTAGFLGGYLISAIIHMILPIYFPQPRETMIISIFSLYLIWVTLFIVAYIPKNGWKAWMIYASIIAVLGFVYYLSIPNNPFIHE